MYKLRNLSLYREIRYQNRDSSHPSLDDYKYALSEEKAEEIAKYLESCVKLAEYVSPTTDPYNEKDRIPFVILSDGVYIWDWVIINWVRKYRVALPEEFLEHYEQVKNNLNFLKNLDYDTIYEAWHNPEGIEEIFIE